MGLDMYLFRTKRVKDFKEQDYRQVEDKVSNFSDLSEIFDKVSSLSELITDKPGVEEFDHVIKNKGSFVRWVSIMDEIGYWRKANQVHNWFVENCQNGIDECQLTEVSKEQLEKLLVDCIDVLNNSENISIVKETLPTQSGFFFGGTEYDEYYFNDIRDTIDILKATLETTDFENEIIFYQSSW